MGQGRAGGHGRRWLVWFGCLMGLWLVLTSTLDPQETAVGVLASALGATAAVAVGAQEVIRIRIHRRWLLRAHRVVGRVVVDNWLALSLLVRYLAGRAEVRGAFRALPFEPGGDDSLAATRRALITISVSVSPNTYVVGIDAESKLILCHQLIPSSKESARRDMLGWL
jgi:multisubunit Na+/H+ antiporter MnhE subunit